MSNCVIQPPGCKAISFLILHFTASLNLCKVKKLVDMLHVWKQVYQ